ncbi:MAG TPA: hypothetical protein VM689_08160 [Aliidongia sp.]|nr:hypothetical protein [Aliidongia sp.]
MHHPVDAAFFAECGVRGGLGYLGNLRLGRKNLASSQRPTPNLAVPAVERDDLINDAWIKAINLALVEATSDQTGGDFLIEPTTLAALSSPERVIYDRL